MRGSEPNVYITFYDTLWWLCHVLKVIKIKFTPISFSFSHFAKLPSSALQLP